MLSTGKGWFSLCLLDFGWGFGYNGKRPRTIYKGPSESFPRTIYKGSLAISWEHLVPRLCDAEFQEVFFFLERKVMSRELHLHIFFFFLSFPPIILCKPHRNHNIIGDFHLTYLSTCYPQFIPNLA